LEWQSRQDRSKVRATFSGIGQSGVTDRGTGIDAVTMCPASVTLARIRAAFTIRMGVLGATFSMLRATRMRVVEGLSKCSKSLSAGCGTGTRQRRFRFRHTAERE
jgi:hypothetical protein